eukprot:NODE_339_length_9219_cov_0.924232.p3 type:complete len:433 gc:universal NODE_339_length_9219_cov_0.924232:2445-1147(-)
MEFVSTRDGQKAYTLREMLILGLAPDQGLFVPKKLPQTLAISSEYDEIALQVLQLFFEVDSVKEIYKGFPKDRTPLKKLGDNHVLELFHGPSFAFKDVALQSLGYLFKQTNEKDLKVIVATSGDTGAAAIHGLKDHNIKVVVLYPKDRVSKVQHAQMTSVNHPCVKIIEMDGTFDECQTFVKTVLHTKKGWCAVNSINFARIVAQMTYYIYAYKQLEKSLIKADLEEIVFNVPTGNFGDVLAGYYTREIFGINFKLHIATNQNDVLVRLMNTGIYERQSVYATHSPAMDITLPSNLERIIYYAGGADYVKEIYDELHKHSKVRLSQKVIDFLKLNFTASSTNDAQTIETIKNVYNEHNYLPCPHTAVAMYNRPKTNQVFLATAHPGKFPDAIKKAVNLQEEDFTPMKLQEVLQMPLKFDKITDYEALLKLIE